MVPAVGGGGFGGGVKGTLGRVPLMIVGLGIDTRQSSVEAVCALEFALTTAADVVVV